MNENSIKYSSHGIEEAPRELNLYEKIHLAKELSILDTGLDPNVITMHEEDAEWLLGNSPFRGIKGRKLNASTEVGLFKYEGMDGRGENGLTAEWKGFVYCNPPFSQKEIWIKKMIEHGNGILILPERLSAPWGAPLVSTAGAYFVMGKKINFLGGSSSNNLGSILIPFGKEAVKRIENSGLPGHFNEVKWFKPRKK